MSKLRKWMSAQELMESWNMNYLKLIDFISKSKITAYDKDGIEIYPLKIINWKDGWGSAEHRIHNLFFIREEVIFYETQNPEINQKNAITEDNKMRPCQRHKIQVRVIAASKWKINPDTTIEDMARDNDINSIAVKNNRKLYSTNTIRNWIKNLANSNKPGRRPKTK